MLLHSCSFYSPLPVTCSPGSYELTASEFPQRLSTPRILRGAPPAADAPVDEAEEKRLLDVVNKTVNETLTKRLQEGDPLEAKCQRKKARKECWEMGKEDDRKVVKAEEGKDKSAGKARGWARGADMVWEGGVCSFAVCSSAALICVADLLLAVAAGGGVDRQVGGGPSRTAWRHQVSSRGTGMHASQGCGLVPGQVSGRVPGVAA